MFSQEDRARIRADLLELARRDERVAGAAITGSGADGREDRWSDIDLAFSISRGRDVEEAAADFTAVLYERHGAVHHLDVRAGAWLYRVFFLAGTLQVDLAFVEQCEFGPMAPTFRLLWGESREAREFPAPAPRDLIGMAWLHALHARSSLERGKLWQSEHMISGTRDYVLTLACLRLGLPWAHGRGFDLLPETVTGPLADSVAAGLDMARLRAALEAVTRALIAETRLADPELAARIEPELAAIINEG